MNDTPRIDGDTEQRPWMPPYGSPIPAGAYAATLARSRAAQVTSIELFRVAPAGTSPDTIRAAKAILETAKSTLSRETWLQGMPAAGKGWFEVCPGNGAAKAWSLSGVLCKLTGLPNPSGQSLLNGSAEDIAWRVIGYSIWKRHNVSVGYFNDMVAAKVEDIHAEIGAAIDVLDERMKGE